MSIKVNVRSSNFKSPGSAVCTARFKCESALATIDNAENNATRLEDRPEELMSHDTICDEALPGRYSIAKLLLQDPVEQVNMALGAHVYLVVSGLAELFPSVDKRLERSLEFHTVKFHGNTRISLQDVAEEFLERLALDDYRVDLERLASIVALGISYNQSILAGLGILTRLDEVIWIFIRPRCATSLVGLCLI